jgi:hypothetical protein
MWSNTSCSAEDIDLRRELTLVETRLCLLYVGKTLLRVVVMFVVAYLGTRHDVDLVLGLLFAASCRCLVLEFLSSIIV